MRTMETFRRYLIAAVGIPVVTGVSLAATASRAEARDEGCFCQPSRCTDADQTCYSLTCSDGSGKTCDGKSKAE